MLGADGRREIRNANALTGPLGIKMVPGCSECTLFTFSRVLFCNRVATDLRESNQSGYLLFLSVTRRLQRKNGHSVT